MSHPAQHLLVHPSQAAPPPGVEPGYVGPTVLPGSGRLVYWTGRVAIGLLWQPEPRRDPGTHAEALQTALLAARRRAQHVVPA